MTDNSVYETITQTLTTMQKIFGAEVFDNPSRFMAGINDIVAANVKNSKTVKHLLRIAICDLHAYTRLKKAHSENNNFVARHIKDEMAKDFMVPSDVCERVIECIAVFVGFEPSSEPAEKVISPTPAKIPQIKPVPIKPAAIKIPKDYVEKRRLDVQNAPHIPKAPQIQVKHMRTQTFSTFSPPVVKSKAGDITRFGGFDWRVLETLDNKILILSEKIIDTKWYHDTNTGTNWLGCGLRQYLNGPFYKTFSHDEQFRIVKTKLKNEKNPWFSTAGTGASIDKIFLLSIAEVLKYFGDSGRIRKKLQNAGHIDDQYNKARAANDRNGSPAWWWLRSSGYVPSRTAFVSANGALYIYGSLVRGDSGNGGGVRPAMWVEV